MYLISNKNAEVVYEIHSFQIYARDSEDRVKLSSKEGAILELLCQNTNKIVERKELIACAWPDAMNADVNLNGAILSIRRKLTGLGLFDSINTIPRVGYVLECRIKKYATTDTLEHISASSINEGMPHQKESVHIDQICIAATPSHSPLSEEELVALQDINSTISPNSKVGGAIFLKPFKLISMILSVALIYFIYELIHDDPIVSKNENKNMVWGYKSELEPELSTFIFHELNKLKLQGVYVSIGHDAVSFFYRDAPASAKLTFFYDGDSQRIKNNFESWVDIFSAALPPGKENRKILGDQHTSFFTGTENNLICNFDATHKNDCLLVFSESHLIKKQDSAFIEQSVKVYCNESPVSPIFNYETSGHMKEKGVNKTIDISHVKYGDVDEKLLISLKKKKLLLKLVNDIQEYSDDSIVMSQIAPELYFSNSLGGIITSMPL